MQHARTFWPGKEAPAHRMLGRIAGLRHQVRAAKQWLAADPTGQERLYAASGAGTGSVWSAPHGEGTQLMPNGHWRVATLKRLGALTPPPGACCAYMNRAGQRCGQQLGAYALHLDLCRHAAGRLRPHTAGVHSLAQRSRRAGANVDVERCIPELAIWQSEEKCVDAIMDLVTWWPGRLQQFLLDLTIRSPHASRYGITEDITGRAGQEKHRRYGEAVWAIAMTTYGRLGYEAMRALDLLAGEAKAAGGDPIHATWSDLAVARRP